MKHAKIIKKGNDMFGILRQGGGGKTYSMKSLGSYVVNEIPYTSFDLSDLPSGDKQQVTHFMNRGLKHHVKRKLQG